MLLVIIMVMMGFGLAEYPPLTYSPSAAWDIATAVVECTHVITVTVFLHSPVSDRRM